MLNFADALRTSIGDEGDSRAVQAKIVLKIDDGSLNEAFSGIRPIFASPCD